MADENAPAAAAMRLKALSRTEKEFAAPLREELPAKLGRFSNVPIGKVIDTENPDFRKMTAGQAAQYKKDVAALENQIQKYISGIEGLGEVQIMRTSWKTPYS